ncbi:MAG: SIR2 family protein [Anaerolineae bacterium]|nr:SIR2 family protein [Anaerolineae bacterium]
MRQELENQVWGDEDWIDILLPIKYGKCTPFLGAGACFGVLPLASDLAQEWAKEHDFPLPGPQDLARIAQFIAVKRNPMRPKYEIKTMLERTKPPDFVQQDEPHGVLASLPLPMFITTNYDDFMMQALISHQKEPKRELCRWNTILRRQPSIFEEQPGFDPTPLHPIVFHLHGHVQVPESLVLTEDDYLDFLVNISKDHELIPPRIQRAFRETTLLFLGYQLSDWDFRVLFRSLVGYLEKSVSQIHVSVQLPPSNNISDEHQREALDYLNRYFDKLNVRVYWGTCRKFVHELSTKWEEFDHG